MVLLFVTISLRAQSKMPDTISYSVRAVTVVASRLNAASRLITTPTSVLSDSDVVALNTRQASELLRVLPGVFLKDYGGLGGIKTVSLRGATAAQTAVYLDGIKLNAAQNGLFDFSTLPSAMIGSIAIHDGTEAAFSNAGAIGGVISIESPSRIDTSASLSIKASYASFNEMNITASHSSRLAKHLSLIASAGYIHSMGDYTFTFNEFGITREYRRSNADYQSSSAAALLLFEDSTIKSSTRLLVRSVRRGAPGAVLQGNVENSSARLNDDDILAIERLQIIDRKSVV